MVSANTDEHRYVNGVKVNQGTVTSRGTERCVACGDDTGIPVETHVDARNNYVEGAGQLCDKCASAGATNK